MNKLIIPAVLIGVLASGSAFAHRGWDDDDDAYRRPCRERERHVVVYQEPVAVYQAPPVVYAPPPPPVMYRERVAYREVPAYAYQPAPTYYRQAPDYAVAYSGNRVAGQAIGAVAGGVIGNQFGRGGGRMVSTAVGAVLGAVVGDRMSY